MTSPSSKHSQVSRWRLLDRVWRGPERWLGLAVLVFIGFSCLTSSRTVAEYNGQGEVTGGIVVVRYGQNVMDVIQRVKTRLKESEAAISLLLLPSAMSWKISRSRVVSRS